MAAALVAALEGHPGIQRVRLAGSRAAGRGHALSDWDFIVETDDFETVEQALPALVAPLDPIAAQWDPYSDCACYMLMLRGPTKVDLLFPDLPREWSDAWVVSQDTLEAVDRHFWDWILWLEQKRTGGRDEVVATSLGDMHRLLLVPLGATVQPSSIPAAVRAYLDARGQREREFGIRVPRELEQEVLPAIRRAEAG